MQTQPLAGPVGHCASQFRAVVAAHHHRITAQPGEAVEFVDEVLSGGPVRTSWSLYTARSASGIDQIAESRGRKDGCACAPNALGQCAIRCHHREVLPILIRVDKANDLFIG